MTTPMCAGMRPNGPWAIWKMPMPCPALQQTLHDPDMDGAKFSPSAAIE